MTIDPRILKVIEEVDELRKTRDDHWQIPRVEGDLLYHIALSAPCKLIVEIGTSYGFSGLFWGAAIQRTGGKLHTIDISQKKYDSAKQTFAKAGLGDQVISHLGDAREILSKINGPIDLAFIDSEKSLCRDFFELVWPKIRPGGSVITDNATTHRSELAEFVAYLRGRSDTSSVQVAVGNGIEWTVKVSG